MAPAAVRSSVSVKPRASAFNSSKAVDLNTFKGLSDCSLKYLRFQCLDMTKTLDFYQSLGMTLEYNLRRNERRMLCFSFKTSSQEFNSSSIQLIFESKDLGFQMFGEEAEAQNKKKDKDGKPDDEANEKKPPAQLPPLAKQQAKKDVDPNQLTEHLVIYTYFLSRLIKLLESKDFTIVLEPQEYADMKFAIVTDPNGIEIRLYECPDSQLNEHGNRRVWYAKVGYYVIPVKKVTDVAKYYESLFSTLNQPQEDKNKVGNRELGGIFAKLNAIEEGPDPIKLSPTDKRRGFRIVDTEEITIGLVRTSFKWLGHTTKGRDTSSCICFVERLEADRKLENEAAPPPPQINFARDSIMAQSKNVAAASMVRKPFLGMGFEVSNLELTMIKLKNEFPRAMFWRIDKLFLNEIGWISRYEDPLFSPTWSVDLFSVHGYAPNNKKAQNHQAITQDHIEWSINYNHLKGHARTLSEGAITKNIRQKVVVKVQDDALKPQAPGAAAAAEKDAKQKAKQKQLEMEKKKRELEQGLRKDELLNRKEKPQRRLSS